MDKEVIIFAEKIIALLLEILAHSNSEDLIKKISQLQSQIPRSIVMRHRVMSYATVDAKKFLGDADIRLKDNKYDDYRRLELEQHIVQLKKIITQYSKAE